jgi:Cu2+-exporting ATPase
MTLNNSHQGCYHCGEPVPENLDLSVDIDGVARAMCCPGCQAVAQMISGSGLDSFYRMRTEFNPRPEAGEAGQHYLIYDDPAVCEDFSRLQEDGSYRTRLLVSGISCAACTWLIEHALQAMPGVSHASVHLARHSLDLEWDPKQQALSAVFLKLEQLGYQGWPWQAHAHAEIIEKEHKQSLRQLAVAGLAMMQVGMFAIALHAGDLQGISLEYRGLMRWVSLLISTLVVFYSARSFFRNAWNNLRHGHLVMDLPVALAIGLAWSASAWATWTNSGQVYFDSVAMFTFFLLLGRFLEKQVRQREILRQTDLQSLLPPSVQRQSGGDWETVATRTIAPGDILQLTAGSAVPADGEVIEGNAHVDESAFSGEHLPRSIGPADTVAAGTLLLDGSPLLRVSASGNQTRLAQMLETLTRAQRFKPRAVLLADRIAGWFVATLLLLAIAVASYWMQNDPQQALWITLSVLVVSCPCALALATPAALASATSSLRQQGLLLSGEQALEQLELCDTILFDKTGTLTRGKPVLESSQAMGGVSLHRCLQIAAALERHSNHPIARAFPAVSGALQITDADNRTGAGISAVIEGMKCRIGSREYVRELNPGLAPPPSEDGHWIALASPDETLAWFQLGDELREEADRVITTLRSRGLQVELLTGDSSGQGTLLADRLSMDAVHCGFDPQQKLDYIRTLQQRGHRVAMVGDGLNDAAVLAAADCSFAVNNATDLAKAQADGIVLGNRLDALLAAFTTATRCRRIIRQNIAWALAYNALAIPLAAAGLIPPWAAALGMSASSLLVVANSLRLNRIQ